jgi:hypothetical protein
MSNADIERIQELHKALRWSALGMAHEMPIELQGLTMLRISNEIRYRMEKLILEKGLDINFAVEIPFPSPPAKGGGVFRPALGDN